MVGGSYAAPTHLQLNTTHSTVPSIPIRKLTQSHVGRAQQCHSSKSHRQLTVVQGALPSCSHNNQHVHGNKQLKRRLHTAAAAAVEASAVDVHGNPNSPVNGLCKDANGANGALCRDDFPKFVQFFRHAGPYIEGHRGRTFVIVIPGNVTSDRALLQSTMSDIALLHGLGVNLVVVVGAMPQIDQMLVERGMQPQYVGGYRITDKETLKIAIEAAGQVRTTCEQFLSKGPAIPMIRRHTKGDTEIHFEPAMRVISGNYIASKRRGVVDGIDFGYTGEVRFVLKDDIKRQLDNGNIVMLSNLGYTAAGEVLNCNTYEVGLHAAVGLAADKMFFLHLDEVKDLELPQWLPLSDAQSMLTKRAREFMDSLTGMNPAQFTVGRSVSPSPAPVPPPLAAAGAAVAAHSAGSSGSGNGVLGSSSGILGSANHFVPGMPGSSAPGHIPGMPLSSGSSHIPGFPPAPLATSSGVSGASSSGIAGASSSASGAAGGVSSALAPMGLLVPMAPAADTPQARADALRLSRVAASLATKRKEDLIVDLDVWSTSGFPPAVSTCVISCCKGVKRAHLLDARLDGGLLLELYSRDGVGTMISADFYEGIRRARPADLDAVRELLRPLEAAGVLVKRSRDELAALLQDFTVLERETKIMGCALLLPLGATSDGTSVAELGAFCVDPAFRGSGRGDSLLDYVEQDARQRGIRRLVLLTTRTADWFEQRDFKWSGPAYASDLIPESRRNRINPARNSQLYVKQLEAADGNMEPGKRIGF